MLMKRLSIEIQTELRGLESSWLSYFYAHKMIQCSLFESFFFIFLLFPSNVENC